MRGYFGLGQLSSEEKSDILNQHKSLYNGYRTMQPEVSNTQPLYVYDDISDKGGMVVNNKGEVKKYTNMGINEQVESKEVCDECGSMIMDGVCECNYGHMEEGELDENMCECGGTMYEGECNECGYGKMDEETGHLDDIYNVRDLNLKKGDFDYVEGGGNDYGTFEGMHKKLYKEDFNSDDDDFEDYESSYTEDGVNDPDNEDDGFEDINASEVTDGEMDEIDIKDLIKGKKYKYNTPTHKAHIEFDSEHEYPEGGENMYGFKKGKTGYGLSKKSVEDFVSHLDDDDELELDEQGYTGGGNAPDMDVSNIKPAYNFQSDGPDDVYPVFEDDMYSYDPEKMYETMESAWADEELDEEMEEEMDEQDISGVQGIYGDMEKPYDFDSNGPGIGGPYQHSSWGGGSTHSPKREENFEEVDEDLRESFLTQKNKINEMFNRFNKYN
jgi:hypothetical protein